MITATLMLCDYAEEVNGKLYIMGGGWSRTRANIPMRMALAVKLEIPWDQTNRPHEMKVELTKDGKPVKGDDDNPIALEGKIEVGRPPGLRAGTPIDAPFAVQLANLTLDAGRYDWKVSIGDEPIAHVSFDAVGGEL